MTAPPRVARRLLSAALPEPHRRVVLADLDEEFESRATRSSTAAVWWYRRQVLASIPGALRLRARFQAADVVRDLRYAARVLRANPAFSIAAILTLTIGIGATSAMLTLSNAVLIRPLPYADTDRIVSVMEFTRDQDETSGQLSWPDFVDYDTGNQTLSAMAVYSGGSRTLTAPGAAAERVPTVVVSGRFFEVLGVHPMIGRTITDADVAQGAPPVVVLPSSTWRKRFGADPDILGRTVELNGTPMTVIGVLGADFEFPLRGNAEFWLPIRPSPSQRERKFMHWLDGVGRIKDGVTIAQANADLDRLAAGFAVTEPRAHQHSSVRLPTIRTRIVGNVQPTLLLLTGAALLVLLVACANIAGLLLAQHASRATEMSVRSVMGAGRSRLFRQLLTENVALALPGGVLGVIAGQAMVRSLVAGMPAAQRLRLPHVASLSLDGQAMAISLGLTLAASALFGLIPAWRSVQTHRLQSTRGVAGIGARELRLQSTFVVVQVALAMMLLAGAGLMMQSLRRLLNVSPGFRTDHLLTTSVALPQAKYLDRDRLIAAHADLLSRVSAMPGVLGAAVINQLPLMGNANTGTLRIVGDPQQLETTTLVRTVSSNYFDVMGIPLVAGRPFAATDTPATPDVVLVNQALAAQAFGGDFAGKRVMFPFMPDSPLEVVGVVGEERFESLDLDPRPVLYFVESQGPDSNFSLVVRTATEPASLFPSLVETVREFDSGIALYQQATMDQILRQSPSVFQRRSVMALIGSFAAAALILAAVGLYGVLTQVVEQRQREIGVRLALGADRADIAGAVIRRGLLPVAVGLVIGLGAVLLAGGALRGLLYGTSANDPVTLGLVAAVLGVAALVACVIPARRAVRVDPASALRS